MVQFVSVLLVSFARAYLLFEAEGSNPRDSKTKGLAESLPATCRYVIPVIPCTLDNKYNKKEKYIEEKVHQVRGKRDGFLSSWAIKKGTHL